SHRRLSLRSLPPPPTCGAAAPADKGVARRMPSAVAPLSRLAFGGGDGHGELVSGGHGGARPRRGHGGARPGHGGARPRRPGGARPRPPWGSSIPAGSSLAVSGDDGHGELGGGGLEELDLGAAIGEARPRPL